MWDEERIEMKGLFPLLLSLFSSEPILILDLFLLFIRAKG